MLAWLYQKKIQEDKNIQVYMLTVPGRVVKKSTLAREFNDKFFKEIALNVSNGWNTAWFYEDEEKAKKDKNSKHGRAAIFKLILPKSACQQSKDLSSSQLSVDLKAIKPEAIQSVTVEELPHPVGYVISNPLLQKDAPITQIEITSYSFAKKN